MTILLLVWYFNSEMNVLEHREDNLVEDFLPELKSEILIIFVEDTEQGCECLLLYLSSLLHDEVSQVSKDGKPEPFLNTVPNPDIIRLVHISGYSMATSWSRWLYLFLERRLLLDSVVQRVSLHTFSVSLIEVDPIHFDEVLNNFLSNVEILSALLKQF